MSLISAITAPFRRSVPRPEDRIEPQMPASASRSFKGAKIDRLASTWTTVPKPLDAEIRTGLRALRARTRDASLNNDFVKHYLRLLKSNVIGPQGIMIKPRSKDDSGAPDLQANEAIKESFAEWCRVGKPDVTGRLSWKGVCDLFMETVAKDGECFVRKHFNWPDNDYGFALEFIDAEAVDVTLTRDLGNGRVINMGIELNEWRRPVAYYVRTVSAIGDIYEYNGSRYKRIPAEQMIHGFLPEAVMQTRGFPWLAVSLMRLHMLAGYEEAELVAARAASAKMGFFERDPSAPGDREYEGDEAADGAMITDAEPGSFEELPAGYKFQSFDPQHPTSAYDSFIKSNQRAMASGLGVSYFTLSNDLTGVNYNSGRLGSLEDRELWKTLQTWIIDLFVRPTVEDWLASALLSGKVQLPGGSRLPPQKFGKFKRIHYQGRRWAWVDPKKDMEGHGLALDRRIESPQNVIIERGGDPGEVLDDWKEWDKMLDERDLKKVPVQPVTEEAEDGEESQEQ